MANGVQITVSADAAQVSTGLNQANKSVGAFSKRVEGIKGAFSKVSTGFNSMSAGMTAGFAKLQGAWVGLLAAFAAFAGFKGLFDEVGRISDLSQRFGESAETIQRLGQAAEIGGSDLESLTKALFKSQLAATDAAKGNEKLQEAFADLGINVEEFMGLPLEEKLKAISDGYVNNENKAKANAAAIAIMGKSAVDLIPLLAQGGEAIGDNMDMVGVFSTETAEKMGEVEDRFKAAFTTLKVWGIDAIGAVLDFVDKLAVGIAAAISAIQELTSGVSITDAPLVAAWKMKDNVKAAREAYDTTLNAGLDDLEQQKIDRAEKTNKVKSANVAQIQAERDSENSGQDTDEPDSEDNILDEVAPVETKKDQQENQKSENVKIAPSEQPKGESPISKPKKKQPVKPDSKPVDFTDENSIAKNEARLGFAERIRQAKAEAQAAAKAKADEETKTTNDNKLKTVEETLGQSQSVLSDLEGKQGRNEFDSLQRIGGGYANSTNQTGAAKQETLLQKQIEAQKEMIDQQKKTIEAIKTAAKTTPTVDGITD